MEIHAGFTQTMEECEEQVLAQQAPAHSRPNFLQASLFSHHQAVEQEQGKKFNRHCKISADNAFQIYQH